MMKVVRGTAIKEVSEDQMKEEVKALESAHIEDVPGA